MSLSAVERETIITWNDEDKTVQIQTAQRPVITSLLGNPGVKIIEDILHDGTRMVTATLPAGSITIRKKKRQGQNKGSHLKEIARCGTIKENGEPCQMIPKKDTGKCRWHS